ISSSLISQAAILIDRLADDLIESDRKFGIEIQRFDRRTVEDRIEDRGGSVARKGLVTCGHFVKNDSKGKEIRSAIDFFTKSLFRRHVGDGTDRCARASQQRIHGNGVPVTDSGGFGWDMLLGKQFSQAEIKNLGGAGPGSKDVCGLDVAMNDAFAVSGVEGIGNLDGDFEQFGIAERTALNEVLERAAVQILHGDKGTAAILSHVEEHANVGMGKSRRGFRFTTKAFERDVILSGVLRQELQTDSPMQA